MRRTYLAVALLTFCAPGCAWWPLSSKWAMDNAEYAEKYNRPYPNRDARRYARMGKQAVDARHVEGMSGMVAGVAAQADPPALGAEIGSSYYPKSWLEGRASLAGVLSDHDNQGEAFGQNAFLGINAGARVSSPTRIAPFVGIGGYGGMSWYEDEAVTDGIDNDDDFLIDEPGETDSAHDVLLAAYPEVGVHIWLTDSWRLTGSAAYYVTTSGREHDFWLFGISLGHFSDPHFSDPEPEGDLNIDWAPPPPGSADEIRRLPNL